MIQTLLSEQQCSFPLLAENIGVLSQFLIQQKLLEFAPDVYWESIFTKWICQAAEIQAGPVLVCVLFEEQASRVLGTCCY